MMSASQSPPESNVLEMQNDSSTPFLGGADGSTRDALPPSVDPPSTNGHSRCCGVLGGLRKKLFSTTPTRVEDMSINLLDIFLVVFSMITYIFDVLSDILVAVVHHQNGDIWWMALTITFILTPSLFGFIFGVYFVMDGGYSGWGAVGYIVRFIVPGIQIIWYNTDAITDACKARKRQVAEEYVSTMHLSTFFALIGVLVEDTPQLILQLYIILKDPNTAVAPIQWASICISLLALSWGITSAYKAEYMAVKKVKISYPAVALVFGWNLFTVWARALALAVCSIYLVYALIGIVCSHFVLSFIFLVLVFLNAASNLQRFGISFMFSVMTIITTYVPRYADEARENTRLHFSFLHLLIYIENVCMLILWYFSPVSNGAPQWLRYLAGVSIIGGYLIGVLCQIMYYVELHPWNFQKEKEMHIVICMPWKDWINTREWRKRIENGVLRKWTEEIRRGREGARNEAEMRKQEEEVKRQEQVFKGFWFKASEEVKEWREEIENQERRIVGRWIDEIRRWGEGERKEEEKRRHEEELQRREKCMRAFKHCPKEIKEEWKKEISTEEGKIVWGWTEVLRQCIEGRRTEEE